MPHSAKLSDFGWKKCSTLPVRVVPQGSSSRLAATKSNTLPLRN